MRSYRLTPLLVLICLPFSALATPVALTQESPEERSTRAHAKGTMAVGS